MSEASPAIPIEKRPWLTTRHAMEYCDCPTVGAFRKWAQRKGIEKSSDGRRYRRRDLDRAMSANRASEASA